MVTQSPLGELVRHRRQRLGRSARQVSLDAGQSPSYVSKLERGLIEPSFKAFAKVATSLHFTSHEIVLAVRLEALDADN